MKRKVAIGALGLLLSAAYLLFCLRSYIAQSSATSTSIAQLRRTISIAPDNARLHYALGRQLWLQNHDLDAAISEYNTAIRFDPYPADYWIELAAAYSVAGNNAGRDAAIARAESAAPYDTTVLWDVANLNLMRGDTIHALHQMRTVMQYGSSNGDRFLELCWKITGNVDTIMAEALPASAGSYDTLLGLMIYLNRVDDAEKVWTRAHELKLAVARQIALPYFDFLLNHNHAPDAAIAWRQYTAMSPALRAYAPAPNNLIVNPNFELPVLNAGLDWRYMPRDGVTIAIDRAAHAGVGTALSVHFDGTASEAGIYQLVPVMPGTEYQISASVRSEIEGVDGPRIGVFDASTEKQLLLSDPVTGNTDWHQIGGSFRAPDSTSLVAIRIVRWPSTSQIRARLWFDNMTLASSSTTLH